MQLFQSLSGYLHQQKESMGCLQASVVNKHNSVWLNNNVLWNQLKDKEYMYGKNNLRNSEKVTSKSNPGSNHRVLREGRRKQKDAWQIAVMLNLESKKLTSSNSVITTMFREEYI